MRILVVEDDRVTQKVLARVLSGWGHEVITASDGKEAWDRLGEETIQFVISDWMMPLMNGVELCRAIREADLGHYVYFILLTGKADKADLVEGIEAGADDFLAKPFDPQELRVRLRSGERILELEHKLEDRNRRVAKAYAQLQRDLKAAAELQLSLLPNGKLDIDDYHFDWFFQPCDMVGGDGFNFIQLDDNHIAFYLWDVAGHGIPAAMLSVTVSKVLTLDFGRSGMQNHLVFDGGLRQVQPPSAVLQRLNERFQANDETMQYFTMVYGVINTRDGLVHIGQAGHPSPILVRPQESASFIGNGGFPIGVVPNMTYDEEHTFRLEPGDRLYLYSDGITECLNPGSEQFSRERLIQHLEVHRNRPLDEALASLETTLLDWRGDALFDDDLSVLAVERA